VEWTSPPTAVGITLSYIGRIFDLNVPGVAIARTLALVALSVGLIALWLRFRATGPKGGDVIYGAALALTATVALAPIVQPWYFIWPLTLCAVVNARRTKWLMVLTASSMFLVLPNGVGLEGMTRSVLSPVVAVAVIWGAWQLFRRARQVEPLPADADDLPLVP
jgi:alpha-1,6-mannosyltransferase